MKNSKPIFLLLSCLLALVFYGCPKPGPEDNCTDPVREYPFPKNASTWLFQPIKPGDSIKFKVYHRINRASPYVYLHDEGYFIRDTVIKKYQMKNTNNSNCNIFMINDYLVADITGKPQMNCQLDNSVLTTLSILFRGKEFEITDIQYLNHSNSWHDSINIGGQNYYNVINFAGVDPGDNYYIDSTACFYNLQYGMLKYIINDTLIYQRKLH